MSAKSTDLARVQEVYDVVRQTQEQMRKLVFTKERFLNPTNDVDDLIAEGLMNRAFRITEEAGKISTDVAARYGFDTRGASGVRNCLAHAYMEVDREIIWQVLHEDCDALLVACRAYCDDMGVDLE